MEKKKIEHQYSVSITMLQRCLSARLIYGSSKSHDGSARIHHGGATNAQDASTIQYGASTIQAGSTRVALRPPMNVHDLVIVMPQSWGGGGGGVLSNSHFFFIRRLHPASTVHQKKY